MRLQIAVDCLLPSLLEHLRDSDRYSRLKFDPLLCSPLVLWGGTQPAGGGSAGAAAWPPTMLSPQPVRSCFASHAPLHPPLGFVWGGGASGRGSHRGGWRGYLSQMSCSGGTVVVPWGSQHEVVAVAHAAHACCECGVCGVSGCGFLRCLGMLLMPMAAIEQTAQLMP